MIRAEARQTGIAAPLVASAILHVMLAAAVVFASRAGDSVTLPPMYKVELIAAPPGPPAIGAVTDAATPDAAKTATPPKASPNAVPIKKPAATTAKT
ncbi:MAG: hypothetical protein WC700_14830, partial [Gemmatimonadaceae bacterium]